MTGMLHLEEDDTYYFDAEAADRPVRFIEKYLRHYQGRFVGQPFILETLQKKIIRDVYGWKVQATKLRRFTEVWFDGAVGAGKSPILAAVGLFGLVGDNEAGAQVFNFANTYTQAKLAVFDTASKFVKNSPELSRHLVCRRTEIRYPLRDSVWRILPGSGAGAGANPSTVLADECHEWANGEAYEDLRDRMGKRQEPLLWVATNAGKTQASYAWRLRERALAALAGKGDPSIYPIVWAAGETAKTDDPAAWKQANPLLGVTITEAKVAAKCVEAMKDPKEEAGFRRLYLGIWPKQQADRWLNLQLWDDATPKTFTPPADSPVFVGVDLSQSDDLSAAVWVRMDHERFYVDSHFWIPRVKAEQYQKSHGFDYAGWAQGGFITLLDEPTISNAALIQIAATILKRSGKKKPEAVCYDPHRADVCVKSLEASDVRCVPIQQGTSITPGCNELDRRLKEHSIVIAENPVMRFCAENTTVTRDRRGNIYPVKPGADGEYEGRRALKIDGVAALVTVLTQARKHALPAKKLQSEVVLI